MKSESVFFTLEQGGAQPLYMQIYGHLRNEMRLGSLAKGARLPSTRALAADLGVSRSTTQLAYDQLEAEGYVESVPYRGYFVAEIPRDVGDWASGAGGADRAGGAGGADRENELYGLNGLEVESLPPVSAPGAGPGAQSGRGPGAQSGSTAAVWSGDTPIPSPDGKPNLHQHIIDFSPSGIDAGSFPYATWRRLTKDVLSPAGGGLHAPESGGRRGNVFLSGEGRGEPEFCAAIAGYLRRARGVICHPGQIIVGAGNEILLFVLHTILKNHITPGGFDDGFDYPCYAMETYTYAKAYRIFKGMGAGVAAISMDGAGMCPDALLSSGANIAYVMPSHQFPTGIVMPVARRQELLGWAAAGWGRYIIEDDYDSELRYRGRPIPALQGMDSQDRVIYMGTFSRAVAPAIRVGYMVLPRGLIPLYEKYASHFSCTVSRIDQCILTAFIGGGYFERHLNRMRTVYRGKQETLSEALAPLAGSFDISGMEAGVHLLMTDRSGRTQSDLLESAMAAGVRVYGMGRYLVREGQGSGYDGAQKVAGINTGSNVEKAGEKAPVTVLVGFASLTKEEIAEGARRLVQAWG
ncbi:MAG: PLP-dependent aminotransferase family protein [Lachnospiraceae bacterium]|jgi:GntR family transcriptional regulator/MocR family aminotransferase|nr:PLP-dependent aminotransferase family protein [Lachnospiraceae bacterium]